MSDNPATYLFSVEEAREITAMDLYTTEELFAIFEAELDDKQVLTRDKYNTCFRQILKKKYEEAPAEANRIKTVINRLFEVLAISPDAIEFRALACGISVFSADEQDVKVKAAFKLYDTNGDGVISLEEMTNYFACVFSVLFALDPSRQAAMGGIPSTDLATMTAQQAFADADKDGNGELSFEEFKEWFSSSPTASLKQEIKGLQEAEKLSKEEILKLQDERRMLQYKVSVLEDMVAAAHVEAQEKTQAAARSEERMKAMKWEMVRQSLPNSPRQPVSWELKEGSLRRASATPTMNNEATLPTKQPSAVPITFPTTDAETVTKPFVEASSSRNSSRTSSLAKKTKLEVIEYDIQQLHSALSCTSSSSDMVGESSKKAPSVLEEKASKPSASSAAQDRVSSIESIRSNTKRNKTVRESKDEPESEGDDFIKELGASDSESSSIAQRK